MGEILSISSAPEGYKRFLRIGDAHEGVSGYDGNINTLEEAESAAKRFCAEKSGEECQKFLLYLERSGYSLRDIQRKLTIIDFISKIHFRGGITSIDVQCGPSSGCLLFSGTLDENTVINDKKYSAGTRIRFIEDSNIGGRVVSFQKETTVLLDNKEIPVIASYPLGDDSREPQSPVQLIQDTRIQGFLFKAGTALSFYQNGKITNGTLAQDTLIQGFLFKAGTEINFGEDGKITYGTLAQDTLIQGFLFKEETSVCFGQNNEITKGTLAIDTVVQGFLFKAKEDISLSNGEIIYGHAYLFNETTLHGIKLKQGSFLSIVNGRIYSATISEDTTIQGRRFLGGTEITFYSGISSQEPNTDEIKVKEGVLAEDTTISGIKYKKGKGILFFESGIVRSGTLAEDTTIREITYKEGSVIELDENYTSSEGFNIFKKPHPVLSGTLARNLQIYGIRIGAGREVHWGESYASPFNNINTFNFIPEKTIEIQNILFSRGFPVTLFISDPNNYKQTRMKIMSGKLERDTIIQGTLFPAGTIVTFNEEGRLSEVTLSKNTKIEGYEFKSPAIISFNEETGKISKSYLASGSMIEINGILFESVLFNGRGAPYNGILARETRIQGILFSAGSTLYFDDGGGIKTHSD